MLEAIFSELWEAGRILVLAGIAYISHKTAFEAAEKHGRLISLRNAVLICGGIALFAAASLGNSSCVDSDPLYGGCNEYSDDGFDATLEQRVAKLGFWFALLMVPAGLGATSARRYELHPWRRPDADTANKPGL